MHQQSLKIGFSIRYILFIICVGRVLIVIRYFFFEKEAFKGLLKLFVYKTNWEISKTSSYSFRKE